MSKVKINYNLHAKTPAFTVDWNSKRFPITDKMKAAIREGSAIALVHGIGDQKIGDTLLNFCKNLYQYYFPKRNIFKSAWNFILGRKTNQKNFYQLVFSFNDDGLHRAFTEWLDTYLPMNPIRKIIYKISKLFNKANKSFFSVKKESDYKNAGYEYADIQIIKNNKKGLHDTIVFRAYEVYWADRFKAPDWLYVWSMFGSSLISLFKKLDIRRPFHFVGCLLLDLYLLLAFIPISVTFLYVWGMYSIIHVLGNPKKFKNILLFPWFKKMFEKYIGDISVYVESPSDAKEVRKVLQDFLARFEGLKWDEYDRKYEKRKKEEDFLHASFGTMKKTNRFKYLSIIAHSFGTVVSFEVLSKFDDDPIAQRITKRIRSFICTGSPLERIRYFWGDKKSRFGYELKNNLAYNWYNFWDIADPVSTKINTFDPHPTNSICFNEFLKFIIPFSHNNYLKNHLVMNRILDKSLGPKFAPFLKRSLVSETGRYNPFRLFKNPFKIVYTFSLYSSILIGLGLLGGFCVKIIIELLSGPAKNVYDAIVNSQIIQKLF